MINHIQVGSQDSSRGLSHSKPVLPPLCLVASLVPEIPCDASDDLAIFIVSSCWYLAWFCCLPACLLSFLPSFLHSLSLPLFFLSLSLPSFLPKKHCLFLSVFSPTKDADHILEAEFRSTGSKPLVGGDLQKCVFSSVPGNGRAAMISSPLFSRKSS